MSRRSLADFAAFQRYLLAEEARFYRCLTRKLLTYAMGWRSLFTDQPSVDRIVADIPLGRNGFADPLVGIATSDEFLTK